MIRRYWLTGHQLNGNGSVRYSDGAYAYDRGTAAIAVQDYIRGGPRKHIELIVVRVENTGEPLHYERHSEPSGDSWRLRELPR